MSWKSIVLTLMQLTCHHVLRSDSVSQSQNPVVSCQDGKKKLLCLPLDYSKFDLPYRNEFNVIDIGKFYSSSLIFIDYRYPVTYSVNPDQIWNQPEGYGLSLSYRVT